MAEHKPNTSYSLIDEEIPAETKERRGAPRSPLEVDLMITFEHRDFHGMTHNISSTGVFVSTYCALPVGAEVLLKFALPNGTVIAKGTVCRVRSSSDGVTGGMGVAFGVLDELDRSLIDAYCAEEPVRRTSDVRMSRSYTRRGSR